MVRSIGARVEVNPEAARSENSTERLSVPQLALQIECLSQGCLGTSDVPSVSGMNFCQRDSPSP